MRTLLDHLSNYAAYHRHVRNIATHFVGIPMIVIAVAGLLAPLAVSVGGVNVSAAMVVALAAIVFYLRLDLRYGIAMAVFMAIAVALGHAMAAQPTAEWLAWSVGAFVVGWVIQFIGHYYEGRKPAFVDDIIGLVIGPLFVVAEAGFLLGMRKEVRHQIEARVGGTRHTRQPPQHQAAR